MLSPLIDIDEFVRLAREDVPESPIPIIRRITQRVLRDFTQETFCLHEEVDGVFTVPEEADPYVEAVVDHLRNVEVAEGGITTLMEDTPPGADPVGGRVTDIGGQTWVAEEYGTFADVGVGGKWRAVEATLALAALYGGKILAVTISKNLHDQSVDSLAVSLFDDAQMELEIYYDEEAVLVARVPCEAINTGGPNTVKFDAANGDLSISVNGESVFSFKEVIGGDFPDDFITDEDRLYIQTEMMPR